MINTNDIREITIGSLCRVGTPCRHHVKVILKDERKVTTQLSGARIHSIISKLDNGYINPKTSWKGMDVKMHFSEYKVSSDRWKKESAARILTSLFKKVSKN